MPDYLANGFLTYWTVRALGDAVTHYRKGWWSIAPDEVKATQEGIGLAAHWAEEEAYRQIAFYCANELDRYDGLQLGYAVFKNEEGRPINQDKWRKKYWYRALRVLEIRPRKFYATRHTFISDALSNGLNIKWVAEYCGTSVSMIETHYWRYIKSDFREQLDRLFGAKPGTFSGTLRNGTDNEVDKVFENIEEEKWSGRVDLNHRPHGPEPCALPS
jgi:hypothetical protein